MVMSRVNAGTVRDTVPLCIFKAFPPVAEGTVFPRMLRAVPQRVFALQGCRICARILRLVAC